MDTIIRVKKTVKEKHIVRADSKNQNISFSYKKDVG